MTSVIHFKFRSASLSETLNFDGDYLTLLDLKRLIAKKKGLLNAADIDFAITNKVTGEGIMSMISYLIDRIFFFF